MGDKSPYSNYRKIFRFSQRTSDVQWHALQSSMPLERRVVNSIFGGTPRTLDNFAVIHSCRQYLPTFPLGRAPFKAKSGNGLACSRGTHSKNRSSHADMLSPKKFRREVCPNNPHLVVSFCAVCNRKAASADLRLLVLAEKLHECWPKNPGSVLPPGRCPKKKPGSEPSK